MMNTKTISRAVFESTNTRAKQHAWLSSYNNCTIEKFTYGGFLVHCNPWVVNGPNGILAAGFRFELIQVMEDGSWRGIVRRDPDVVIVAEQDVVL